MTFELGLMRTWRFPAFSALLMALSASLSTLVLTIFKVDRVEALFYRGSMQRMRFSTPAEVRYL